MIKFKALPAKFPMKYNQTINTLKAYLFVVADYNMKPNSVIVYSFESACCVNFGTASRRGIVYKYGLNVYPLFNIDQYSKTIVDCIIEMYYHV